MSSAKRYAIITPYHKESKELLQRCIESVRAQTVPTDQFMIADGFAQDWIDREPVRHLKLDREHCDLGNTPRAIGALLAISERYDAIGLLDADNWLEGDHIAKCIEASGQLENCDYVIARRNLCRPDGSVLNVSDEPIAEHVDMNCFLLLPGSYHVLLHLGLMPRELSLLGDRLFYGALRAANLNAQILQDKTVNYHCIWQFPYNALGEPPPPNSKPTVHSLRFKEWMEGRTPRELEMIYNRCGSKFWFL